MKVAKSQPGSWHIKPTDPAILTTQDWVISGILGALLLAAGIIQLINFSDFRDNFEQLGINTGATAWAIGIIVAELWGAANMFKLRLSYGFRIVSAGLAILAASFWFVLNLQLISDGKESVSTSNFFGRFLDLSPGWWSAIIVTVLLFWTLYAVALTRYSLPENGHIKIPVKKAKGSRI
jgi:hypothetical protein